MTGLTILMGVFHEDVVVITKLPWGAPYLLFNVRRTGACPCAAGPYGKA